MSATGLDVFDKTLQTTHIWLNEITEAVGPDKQVGWHVLGAVLRTLRNRVPLQVAVHLGAELPLLVRGLYYDQWRASDQPERYRTLDEFLGRVTEQLRATRPVDPASATRAVFAVLSRHVPEGQLHKVREALPEDVRALWSEPAQGSRMWADADPAAAVHGGLIMAMEDLSFRDRAEAGRQLATHLMSFRSRNPVVLALPRGGVPVAFEVARALRAPLDLVLVRKIGAPGHPELGLGAVVDGAHPQLVINEDLVAELRVPASYIEGEAERQLQEIERRRKCYLEDRRPIKVEDLTVIMVDDGIATGGTVRAALQGLSRARPANLVLAVPVAPPDTIAQLRAEADEVVCLFMPSPFYSVSLYYDDFTQTSDAEVVALLNEAQAWIREATP